MYYCQPVGATGLGAVMLHTCVYVCVHVCMCTVCLCSCICVCQCMCICKQVMWRPAVNVRCLSVSLYTVIFFYFQAVIHQTCSSLILQDQLASELWTAPISAFTVLELQGCTFQLGAGDQNSGPHACMLSTFSLKHLSSPPLFLFVVYFKFVRNCLLVSFFKISFFTLSEGNQVFNLILPQLPRKDDK